MRSEAFPRRRLRDQLVERNGTENPTLKERHSLTNQLLLVDDDLRECALALGSVEKFLAAALALLDDQNVTARPIMKMMWPRYIGLRV